MEEKCHHLLQYYPRICLKGFWKTTTHLRKDSWFLDWDLKLGHHVHKAGLWHTQSQCLALLIIVAGLNNSMTSAVYQSLIYNLHEMHPNSRCWPCTRIEYTNIYICFYFQEFGCVQTRIIRLYCISVCLSTPQSEH